MQQPVLHILIIGNSNKWQENIYKLFSRENCQVWFCGDIDCVLQHVETKPVDIILVDATMETFSFVELLKNLSPYALSIPVFFSMDLLLLEKHLTAHSQTSITSTEGKDQFLLSNNSTFLAIQSFQQEKKLKRLLQQKTDELNQQMHRYREKVYELQLSEEKYRLILKNIHEVVFIINLKQEVVYASPSTYEVTGYRPKNITYDVICRILPGVFSTSQRERIIHREAEKVTFYDKNGSQKQGLLTIKPYYLHNKLLGYVVVLFDVSRVMQIQKTLEDTLQELSLVYDAISEYIFIFTEDLLVHKVNKSAEAFLRLLNPDLDTFVGKRWGELIQCPNHLASINGCGTHEQCKNCPFRNFLLHVTEKGVREELRFQVPHGKDWDNKYFIAFGKKIRYQEASYVFLSLTDVTFIEKKKEEIVALHERFSQLVEHVDEGYLLVKCPEKSFVFCNERLPELLMMDKHVLEHDPLAWTKLLLGDITEFQSLLKSLAHKQIYAFQTQVQYLMEDQLRWFNLYISRLEASDESLVAFVFSDITNMVEQNIREQNQLLIGSIEERKKIARKIHDEINPFVSLFISQYTILQRFISAEGKELYEKQRGLIQLLQRELYQLSHEIAHEFGQDFPFMQKVLDTVKEFSLQMGVNIEIFIDKEPALLLHRLHLYAVMLELLNNAMKHAKAKHIVLSLTHHQNFLVFSYKDDGMGFNLNEVLSQGKGLGLKHMQDRVREMGGTLQLLTQPGMGVEVNIYLFI